MKRSHLTMRSGLDNEFVGGPASQRRSQPGGRSLVFVVAAYALFACFPLAGQMGSGTSVGAQTDILPPTISAKSLSWGVVDTGSRTLVNLVGPEGYELTKLFAAGRTVVIDLSEMGDLADGKYSYSVRTLPAADDGSNEGFATRYKSGMVRIVGGLAQPRSADVPAEMALKPKSDGGLQAPEPFTVNDLSGKPFIQLEDTTVEGTETEDDWWMYVDRAAAGDGSQDFAILWQDHTVGGTVTNALVIGNDINEDALYLRSRGSGSTTEIGVNTGSPSATLHLASNAVPDIRFEDVGGTPYQWEIEADSNSFDIFDVTGGTTPFRIDAGTGAVEIGTSLVAQQSGARLSVAGVWTNASSRSLKENIQPLELRDALSALELLEPVRYNYIVAPGDPQVGFIAEDVPELVATPDRKTLAPTDVVGVLTRVVQEQQSTIDTLLERVRHLEDGVE